MAWDTFLREIENEKEWIRYELTRQSTTGTKENELFKKQAIMEAVEFLLSKYEVNINELPRDFVLKLEFLQKHQTSTLKAQSFQTEAANQPDHQSVYPCEPEAHCYNGLLSRADRIAEFFRPLRQNTFLPITDVCNVASKLQQTDDQMKPLSLRDRI